MPWFRRDRADGVAVSTTAVDPQPEQAWKALTLMNEWIRHADAKTGVTLAFVGATATILFQLIKDHRDWSCALIIATSVAVLGVIAAISCATFALLPRLRPHKPRSGKSSDVTIGEEETVNLLFFGDVHRKYRDDGPSYRDVLSLLTADPIGLTGHIADQVHANAHIASMKFRYVNRAITCELLAVVAVASVALLRVTGW